MRSDEVVVVDKESGVSTEAIIARLQAQEDAHATPGVRQQTRKRW